MRSIQQSSNPRQGYRYKIIVTPSGCIWGIPVGIQTGGGRYKTRYRNIQDERRERSINTRVNCKEWSYSTIARYKRSHPAVTNQRVALLHKCGIATVYRALRWAREGNLSSVLGPASPRGIRFPSGNIGTCLTTLSKGDGIMWTEKARAAARRARGVKLYEPEEDRVIEQFAIRGVDGKPSEPWRYLPGRIRESVISRRYDLGMPLLRVPFTTEDDRRILAAALDPRRALRGQRGPLGQLAVELGRSYHTVWNRKAWLQENQRRAA